MDKWIGTELATLKNGRVNDAIWTRLRSFQWRVYNNDKNKYKLLGSKCK